MECKAAGKKLLVWTVNEPDHMMEVRILCYFVNATIDSRNQAVRWGVDAILTDVTKTWLDMRTALYCTYPRPNSHCSSRLSVTNTSRL